MKESTEVHSFYFKKRYRFCVIYQKLDLQGLLVTLSKVMENVVHN